MSYKLTSEILAKIHNNRICFGNQSAAHHIQIYFCLKSSNCKKVLQKNVPEILSLLVSRGFVYLELIPIPADEETFILIQNIDQYQFDPSETFIYSLRKIVLDTVKKNNANTFLTLETRRANLPSYDAVETPHIKLNQKVLPITSTFLKVICELNLLAFK